MTSRQLAEQAEEVYSLLTKPDTQKLLDSDYIFFDPNISVNWNISQVDKHNLEYMKAVTAIVVGLVLISIFS